MFAGIFGEYFLDRPASGVYIMVQGFSQGILIP
jgi:hypothetical protein